MELNEEELKEIVDSIQMNRVFSTNLIAMGYNPDKKVLRVIFKGNSSYLYFDVEPEVYETLNKSESKGRSLNECITKQRDKYKYLKLN